MNAARSLCAVLALALTALHAAGAQSSGGLTITPGTELRLTPRAAGAPQRRGRVVRLAGDTLVLREGDAISHTALSDLAALEVRGGEDKRRGFLIGAGVAAGITGVFGGIDVSKGNISRDDFVGTLIVNALIGGLVGYAFAPKGWERIPLPASDR
ncbi:MAG TPA: hypothetical protein VFN38_05965 [Gemmatimonadaceae bacterium]|nr:hypothetical protein [Gemmatimonadaceae bacterium]